MISGLEKFMSLPALFLIYVLALIQTNHSAYSYNEASSCYDYRNKPVRCSPDFINAAYNRTIMSSNTCGATPREYCVQTNLHSSNDYSENRFEKCDICDMKNKPHPADHMIDFKNEAGLTWWQSDTIEYDIQYPNSVNITIHLGKTFDITYVQIKFYSSRPESFAIYKRTNETSEWAPYQYYSGSCEQTYGKNPREIVYKGSEAIALCSDEFSDIAPLSGASVAFSTLEGRPSAYNFENSEELKEWVTASDIRLTLNRLNTFGDEVFGDPKVLRSYYYAISDISIGGRCKCNGHAEKCIEFEDNNLDSRLKCQCEHNTDGIDCERCAPFYNDRPWAAATYANANECEPCDCNGLSDECVFNATLYELTGHGGVCINCKRNTEGLNCENCKHGFYRREYDNECLDCNCHRDGSVSQQCDPMGKCRCKPGVYGDKCDKCMPNYYGLTHSGCKMCSCNQVGSFDTPAYCDPSDGKCRCKSHVEGQNCDRCKPGFYNLDANLTLGCLSCFCFGHSIECKSSSNHVGFNIDASFSDEDWTSIDSNDQVASLVFDKLADGIYIYNKDKDIWFNAPKKYLGNQRNSYNQDLSFRLKFSLSHSSVLRKDVILEGNGLQVHRQIYDSVMTDKQRINDDQFDEVFHLRLRESENWRPSLSSKDFQRLLTNLTAIRLKTTFGGNTILSMFNLQSAKKISKTGLDYDPSVNPLNSIEECTCPASHSGQFCENCQVGYRREIPFADSFTKCVPCACNNHSISCNPISGKCNCIHHTFGENCELCQDGYYGDALIGTPNDCKKCPCPNDGPCVEIYNHQSSSTDVVCLNCPEGTRGNMCDLCEDGYSISENSDETNLLCEKCICNSNIDENAIGNCDATTGKCLRCVYNTSGDQCEKCLPHYWGNALTDLKCHACECFEPGSETTECNLNNGQCKCKTNVIGRQCNQCKDTYWNIASNKGCTECNCDPVGSSSLLCDIRTGACNCQPGVTGLKCDKCMPNYFNLSMNGCVKCNCDEFGSTSQQCDHLGKCKCKPNISGDKCNKCEENYFNFTASCSRCPQCYDLVQDKAAKLNSEIKNLTSLLENFNSDSTSVEMKEKSKELAEHLSKLKTNIDQVHQGLFDKNLLKPTYKESIKYAEDSLQVLNSELKKLSKPSALMEKQFEELIKLTNVTLVHLLSSISLQETSNTVSLEAKKDLFNSLKEQNQLKSDAELEQSNPTAFKLKNLAATARKFSSEQNLVADQFSKLINSYIVSTRTASSELTDIISRQSRLQLASNDINYESLAKSSQSLLTESNNLKKSLDSKIKQLNQANAELSKNLFSEDKYQSEIQSLGSKADDLNTKFAQSKSKVENVTIQVDKSMNDLITKMNQINNSLSNYIVKNENLNNLLERSQKARNQSEEASTKAKDSFNNASKILSTLESFDSIVNSNKEKALQSQGLEKDINSNLNSTKYLHLKSMRQISQSKLYNTDTSKNLDYAKSVLDDSFKKTNVLNRTKSLSKTTKLLLENVNELENKNQKILSVLNKSIDYNEQTESRLESIQFDSDQVVEKSQALLSNVINAEYDLDQIGQINSSLVGIRKEDILKLERDYDQVFNNHSIFDRIDKIMIELYEKMERNQQELKLFEREIPQLNKQINELNLVKTNLNSECDLYRKRKYTGLF